MDGDHSLLAGQPARWKVSGAFFWSMGSWDPQGVGHAEFGDQEIVKAIERHNQSTASVNTPQEK